MNKVLLLFVLLHIMSVDLSAQAKSLGFFVNAIHNFSYVDKDFDRDRSIKKPMLVLPSYALEYYVKKLDKKIGYHASLGAVWEGIRIRRKFAPPSNSTSETTISGLDPSLKVGIYRNHKSFRIASGLNFRFISNSFVPIFGPIVENNESYQDIANFEYIVKNSVHTSVYVNVDYKILDLSKSEIRLNFIGNIGLHPIYRSTGEIRDLIKNETTIVAQKNYGTYLGLGVKIVRSTDDRFKEIFNFKWK